MNSICSTRVLLAIVLSATSLACPTKTIPGSTGTGGASGGGGAGSSAGSTGVGGAAGVAGLDGGGAKGGASGSGIVGAGGGGAGGAGQTGGTAGAAGAAGSTGAPGGRGGNTGGGGTAGTAGGAAGGAGGPVGGAGGSLKMAGSTCSGSDQCSSGLCRDSVCCAASCTLSCQGCASAVTGMMNGTCAMRTSSSAGVQLCGDQCVNVDTSDASNCGSCGHSCAGGTCSAGQCQPLSLGTIPSGSAGNLVLSGGDLYVITAALNVPPNVWQLDPKAASTPVQTASSVSSSGTPRCVMDGRFFWAAVSTGTNMPTPIKWCAVSNCAATTATLLTSPGQAENPVCDTAADELVWADTTSPASGFADTIETIYRVAPNGSNMRTMTSFYQIATGDYYNGIGFLNGSPDRYFFIRETYSPSKYSLFYIGTNSAGVSPVQIATGTPGQGGFNPGPNAWANDTVFVWDDGGAQLSYHLPLPSGITGAAAIFYQGRISNGIMDNQNLYGAFTTLPTDAIGTCALSNCTNPSAIFRGQENAYAFTQDSTAIYWSTNSATGDGFTVWKGAK